MDEIRNYVEISAEDRVTGEIVKEIVVVKTKLQNPDSAERRALSYAKSRWPVDEFKNHKSKLEPK